MGWFDYYRLIEKYGSVDKAPAREQHEAAKANPNTPPAARALAERIWTEEHTDVVLGREVAATHTDRIDLMLRNIR